MHDKLMKMLGKKRNLSEHEKNAKMDVMKEMRDEASSAMHDKLGGLKKVSVMADSHEGLKHGLEKAHDLIGSQDDQEQAMAQGGKVASDDELEEMTEDAENAGADAEHAREEHEGEGSEEDESEESPEHEASESPEEEMSEHGMSEEEIDAQLKHLMSLKEKLGKS